MDQSLIDGQVELLSYAIPVFLIAILLVVLFAGGHYFKWFPLNGLISENFNQLSWWQKIIDYFGLNHRPSLETLLL